MNPEQYRWTVVLGMAIAGCQENGLTEEQIMSEIREAFKAISLMRNGSEQARLVEASATALGKHLTTLVKS
jgi:hypothetical protein